VLKRWGGVEWCERCECWRAVSSMVGAGLDEDDVHHPTNFVILKQRGKTSRSNHVNDLPK
jgi:hypothetical protein